MKINLKNTMELAAYISVILMSFSFLCFFFAAAYIKLNQCGF